MDLSVRPFRAAHAEREANLFQEIRQLEEERGYFIICLAQRDIIPIEYCEGRVGWKSGLASGERLFLFKTNSIMKLWIFTIMRGFQKPISYFSINVVMTEKYKLSCRTPVSLAPALWKNI